MNKSRLLLIRPNSSIEIAPPPLGLMYIASYLRNKQDEFDIKILDSRVKDLSFEEIEERIKDCQPEYIGITSMHVDSPELHKVAQISKSVMKDPVVIAGGPYPTSGYKQVMEDSNIDFCVVGEGEIPFAELMKALRHGLDYENIRDVAFRIDGEMVYNGSRELISDLDSIPIPAWDLIEMNDYFYGKKRSLENPVQIHKRAVSVISSRGCPYGCTYCHNIFGKKFRARSPENVIKELKYLVDKYSIQEIEFLDDTFNYDKERACGICDLIIEEKLKLGICFSNGLRADRMDEELIIKLKQAGTYRINYGIESTSARMQKSMGKKLNLIHAKDIIEKTYRHKILCGAFFMIGFPTETEDEILETIRFAAESKLHTAVFNIVTPFPGTRLYKQAEEMGSNVGKSFSTVGKVSVNMSAVSNEKLAKLRVIAYRRFYFNVTRCWRLFVRVPRKLILFKNFIEVARVSLLKKELYG